jgi:hypothetical protein
MTTIHYEMGGRQMRWDISAHPSDDDANTLKEHLLEWFGPEAIFIKATYTEDRKEYTYPA